MHQVGLAETDTPIEKEWVDASLGDAPGGSVGQFVGLTDDEILEGEALVENRDLRLVLADIHSEGRFKQGRIGWPRNFLPSCRSIGIVDAVAPGQYPHDD